MESCDKTNVRYSSNKNVGSSLAAIISKRDGRMEDNDRYEIEGILQKHADGWVILDPVYRTDSRNVSTTPEEVTNGTRMYLETQAIEKGSILYDVQGFYRELSKEGYCLIDSRLK